MTGNKWLRFLLENAPQGGLPALPPDSGAAAGFIDYLQRMDPEGQGMSTTMPGGLGFSSTEEFLYPLAATDDSRFGGALRGGYLRQYGPPGKSPIRLKAAQYVSDTPVGARSGGGNITTRTRDLFGGPLTNVGVARRMPKAWIVTSPPGGPPILVTTKPDLGPPVLVNTGGSFEFPTIFVAEKEIEKVLAGLEKHGVTVVRDATERLKRLGAEASYMPDLGEPGILFIGDQTGYGAAMHEARHFGQDRRAGYVVPSDVEVARRELEAHEYELRNARRWGYTEGEITRLQKWVEEWRKQYDRLKSEEH